MLPFSYVTLTQLLFDVCSHQEPLMENAHCQLHALFAFHIDVTISLELFCED